MKHLKKIPASLLALLLASSTLAGCQNNNLGQTTPIETSTPIATTATTDSTSSSETVSSTAAIDTQFSERDKDFSYDSKTATHITLNKNAISVSGNGASASGSVLTISAEGTYVLSGTLENGQIIIDAPDTDKIQIVLNGVTIHSEAHAPIYIKQADKVFLTLAADTLNTISDGNTYSLSEVDSNVDAAIFSKADLTINGSGALTVTANYKHGIVSKDDLIVTGGTITVNANGQGLSGKDRVKIADGTFNLTTKSDGIQSDNTEDPTKGYIYISGGTFNITSETDGLQAETVLRIDDGTFDISTGGGSANASTNAQGNPQEDWGKWGASAETESNDTTASTSAKALKSGSELIINGGIVTIDSSDDSLHSNGSLSISGGNLTLSSGDDGIHADAAVTIHSGTILITKSYEGIEGNSITVNGGDISLTATDDGFNAAGGNDSSSIAGRPGQNAFSTDSDVFILITGGNINVDASGDGIDSNGSLSVLGGTVFVNGPTNSGNGALDYDGSATISGGVVVAAGSSGMTQNFSSSSTQSALLYGWDTTLNGGTPITLTDANGKEIVAFTPTKNFQSVVISTPTLIVGETYTLSAGTQVAEVTLSSTITSEGVSGGRGQGTMGGGRGQKGKQGAISGSEPPQGERGTMGGSRPEKGGQSPTSSEQPPQDEQSTITTSNP